MGVKWYLAAFFCFYLFFSLCRVACRISLVARDHTGPLAIGAWSLSPWTTREVPHRSFQLILSTFSHGDCPSVNLWRKGYSEPLHIFESRLLLSLRSFRSSLHILDSSPLLDTRFALLLCCLGLLVKRGVSVSLWLPVPLVSCSCSQRVWLVP